MQGVYVYSLQPSSFLKCLTREPTYSINACIQCIPGAHVLSGVKGALKRKSNCPTRFSKHKPDWSIQCHRERVTKLLFSRDWQLFLQPQVIDGA